MADIPESSKGDVAYALGKGLLSSIPVAGGVLGEVFGVVVAPPYANRQKEWMQSVETRLVEVMQRKALTPEDLHKDESFVSVTLKATRIALQIHDKEQLEALRNAILNTASAIPIPDALRDMFLNHVEVFSGWHLRILKFAEDPQKCVVTEVAKRTNGAISLGGNLESMILVAYPDLKDQKEFLTQVVKDLNNRGLSEITLATMMTESGLKASRISKLGKQFLDFISDPKS